MQLLGGSALPRSLELDLSKGEAFPNINLSLGVAYRLRVLEFCDFGQFFAANFEI